MQQHIDLMASHALYRARMLEPVARKEHDSVTRVET
jgi:hypothetical protein